MKKHNLLTIATLAAAAVAIPFVSSCKDDPEPEPPIGGGGYTSSDEVAADNLVAKFSFEGNMDDAKGNITGGSSENVSFGAGAKGQAFQGAANGYALYSSVSSAISGLQSVTVSTWVKTSAHTSGAESWFQLLNDSNWIGNMFILQESGTPGNDSTRIKFTVNNWNAPAWKEQWMDLSGTNRMVIGDDMWHHVVCSYDAASSMAAFYVDGVKMNLPDGVTKRYGSDPTAGGEGLGALSFKNATRFVFGCYKQSLPGGTPDGWMMNYDGGLDEFRMYNKALADADVKALYDLEKVGK